MFSRDGNRSGAGREAEPLGGRGREGAHQPGRGHPRRVRAPPAPLPTHPRAVCRSPSSPGLASAPRGLSTASAPLRPPRPPGRTVPGLPPCAAGGADGAPAGPGAPTPRGLSLPPRPRDPGTPSPAAPASAPGPRVQPLPPPWPAPLSFLETREHWELEEKRCIVLKVRQPQT